MRLTSPPSPPRVFNRPPPSLPEGTLLNPTPSGPPKPSAPDLFYDFGKNIAPAAVPKTPTVATNTPPPQAGAGLSPAILTVTPGQGGVNPVPGAKPAAPSPTPAPAAPFPTPTKINFTPADPAGFGLPPTGPAATPGQGGINPAPGTNPATNAANTKNAVDDWAMSLAPRSFDRTSAADIREVNRIYDEQLRPGLMQRKVNLDRWITPVSFFVAKAGIVPDGFRGQAETLLDSKDPESQLIGAQMITTLHKVSPGSVSRFDQEKVLFALDIVKSRFGEGPLPSQDTRTAIAMAQKNRPANANRLRADRESRTKLATLRRADAQVVQSVDILERMGIHKGGDIQNFTPTLHRVLNDMLKFREKGKNDPGYSERIDKNLGDYPVDVP